MRTCKVSIEFNKDEDLVDAMEAMAKDIKDTTFDGYGDELVEGDNRGFDAVKEVYSGNWKISKTKKKKGKRKVG